jgi:hypothetical protein
MRIESHGLEAMRYVLDGNDLACEHRPSSGLALAAAKGACIP